LCSTQTSRASSRWTSESERERDRDLPPLLRARQRQREPAKERERKKEKARERKSKKERRKVKLRKERKPPGVPERVCVCDRQRESERQQEKEHVSNWQKFPDRGNCHRNQRGEDTPRQTFQCLRVVKFERERASALERVRGEPAVIAATPQDARTARHLFAASSY